MNTKFSDIRNVTYQSRCDIGFLANYKLWKDEPATFTSDTLTILGHPVMETWEREYMAELASIATSTGGIVLEVGFGMGISATYIQDANIAAHYIIEANDDVFEELKAFSKGAPHKVLPLHGFWQDVTPTLRSESIDGILFDTYPLTKDEIHKNHFNFFSEAYRLLKPGGVFTYYSDEINEFSDTHKKALKQAGFKNIDKKICQVNPPKECQYWKSKTIVAPIISK